MNNKSYKLCDGVIFRAYSNFGLIVNVPLRKHIILNHIASKILNAIGEKASEIELIKRIKKVKLDRKDLTRFIKILEKQKIIEETDD